MTDLCGRRPILCLDFDGVASTYESGWKGAAIIPDPHVPGLFEFLEEAKEFFDVQVFSSRSNQEGGIMAMTEWFIRERRAWREAGSKPPIDTPLEISFPLEKPPAFVGLDDRVLTFTGQWPSVKSLQDFKPWNKKEI